MLKYIIILKYFSLYSFLIVISRFLFRFLYRYHSYRYTPDFSVKIIQENYNIQEDTENRRESVEKEETDKNIL